MLTVTDRKLPPLPERMKNLPVDPDRGYVVPWFVLWRGGKPEFRVMKPQAREMAWTLRLCWVCGGHVPNFRQTFVIGPMCVINGTTAEPGCHKECAAYSATACPFLTKPHMSRRENGLPDGGDFYTGAITRNPGAVCLWTSETAEQFDSVPGEWLIRIGEAVEPPLWFAEGREARPEEVAESVRTGLPILRGMAEQGGTEAVAHLERLVQEARQHMPDGCEF